MNSYTATATAHPNIAFIKYWGNRNASLRIPDNGSISMNLNGLVTKTTVTFREDSEEDVLILNGKSASYDALQRVRSMLNLVRTITGIKQAACVESENNFPTGAGIASSAAAFAALAAAASKAAGLDLDEPALSRLARHGSGSACRSIPSGFVEWLPGDDDLSSYAISIAPPQHWNLVDCIAIVRELPKSVGSTTGHGLAPTSPLQACRVTDAPRRLEICRKAILERDFDTFAKITELDSNLMHAVMMTSTPSLFYWSPASLKVMAATSRWRADGIPVCYTLDAGPNVHLITTTEYVDTIKKQVQEIQGVQRTLCATPGGPVSLTLSSD
ncbi:MAG: diphosphomevalonate decarboxylase [Anaerolineaceae bacterium]|nr:diphosphomevalonate decarboxylase [Anaerolineaceae bacterium]